MNHLKEPLKTILKLCCQVEAYDPEFINESIRSGGFPCDVNLFKNQLKEAIDDNLITPNDYEKLTDEDFDSQENLQLWLKEILSELP